MKPFLFTIAMVILYSIFLIYQTDNNSYIRQLENLKYVADECAGAASLYYDEELFSKGLIVYNQEEGKKAIEYILKTSLKTESDLTPLSNSYWQEQIEYEVYFLDNSNTTFPVMFVDNRTSYNKLITEPTIIVTVDAGKPRFRLSFLKPERVIRTSAYEYYER